MIYIKITKKITFFNLIKLFFLIKLYIFLLFKIYFTPTFKLYLKKNFIFKMNFFVYAKKNITKKPIINLSYLSIVLYQFIVIKERIPKKFYYIIYYMIPIYCY